MTPRLLDRYRSDVHAKLMDEFGYRNPFQVPTLSKIVVNVGLGEAAQNPKLLERASEELAAITGQKALVRRARKSVANFKLRQGQPIGAMVTLRISDSGVGIDAQLLPRVCDPFVTTKGAEPGSGLGLHAAHSALLAQGGAIRLSSKPGEGTTVTAEFALEVSDPEPQTTSIRDAAD